MVICSDGDVVFQPRKIERSGLFEAVGGNVLIYVHKEQELPDIERRYPADHYVLVDDKLRLLTAFKQQWGGRVTTVFPRLSVSAANALQRRVPRTRGLCLSLFASQHRAGTLTTSGCRTQGEK